MKNCKGFTFVETLIALLIVAFVVVSILNGFAVQMYTDRQNVHKNLAVTMAEAKIEEYLKFPAADMPGNSVDYIVESGNLFKVFAGDPNLDKQFRRTTTVSADAATGNMRRITVLVEYGFMRRTGKYPFRLSLNTMRGG